MSNGYRKLWFAVLEQAIKDSEGYLVSSRDDNDRIKQEARRWFLSENQGIGTFLWICLMLDLNPEFLRKHIGKKYPHSCKKIVGTTVVKNDSAGICSESTDLEVGIPRDSESAMIILLKAESATDKVE
jgi:hypothetical protein